MAAIKLNSAQRDAIYAEAILALSGTGDIRIELDNGDYVSARSTRCVVVKVRASGGWPKGS
jgi:hypothetical protein